MNYSTRLNVFWQICQLEKIINFLGLERKKGREKRKKKFLPPLKFVKTALRDLKYLKREKIDSLDIYFLLKKQIFPIFHVHFSVFFLLFCVVCG